jgi:hypothetical protein
LGFPANINTRYGVIMITMVLEQFGVTLGLAFLSGIILCVAVILIKNGKAAAVKRKKTKLGLVKVAGVGLNLDEEEQVSSESEPESGAVESQTANEPADNPQEPESFDPDNDENETIAVRPEALSADDDASASFDPADDRCETIAVRNEQADDAHESAPEASSPPLMPIPAAPSGKPVPKKRVPETVRMKDRKVLLVEDVQTNRELISMFFEGSGVKLDFAENGKEACEIFEKTPENYSLILMDIQMPIMDGYDATRNIRSMAAD